MKNNNNQQENATLIIEQPNQLWLGDLTSAQNKVYNIQQNQKWLKQNKIGCVITVANGQPISYQDQTIHHYYFIDDKPDFKISKYFTKVFKDIDREIKNTNILIHCAAGISRSAAFVIGYLMQKNNISYKEAYQYVKIRRPKIQPNPGFVNALQQLGAKQQIH